MQNAKATFAADANLTMALREFDPPNNKKCIFELEQGTLFNAQDGRVFSKDAKRRTRFVCTCVKTKKQYLFPPFVEVSPI
jgi:Cu2+-containing amine oxidase